MTSPDQLPIIPEAQVIEPIVQCGVLYLGTALPSPGRRGLDSVQEPFAHRYPVDGTNTVRGIDAILSIYENGMQLAFARQPHTVIFFPISSLLYCASLRFSIVESDHISSIDWRFITLDTTVKSQSNHPPLFCAVVQRTQIVPGDECHCFITKSDDAALALVRTISEVYATLKNNVKPFKSPIFYQLDRYGRKITETTGIIYISPDNDNEARAKKITDHNSFKHSTDRNCLLDSSSYGYFYRTDASSIEKWELWGDADVNQSRPRPPASPFGLHHGLYHDDLTHEVHHHLSHMDDEDRSTSSSCSSSSSESNQYDRHRHSSKQRSKHETDPFNTLVPQSQTSSFDPSLAPQYNVQFNTIQKPPIVIEKVIPNNRMMAIPQQVPNYAFQQVEQAQNYGFQQAEQTQNYGFQQAEQVPTYVFQQPQQVFNPSVPIQEPDTDYASMYDGYYINERGEKITREGNRILYMDVIQANATDNDLVPKSNEASKVPRRHRRRHRRRFNHVPVLDAQAVESIINEKKAKQQRRKTTDADEKYLTTSDMLEMVDEYFGEYKGKKHKSKNHPVQTKLDHLELSNIQEYQESNSSNNKTYHRRRRSHATLTSGPSITYVERPPPMKHASEQTWIEHQQQSNFPPLNNEQVNEYVTNIYGTSKHELQSVKSPAPSTNNREAQAFQTNTHPVTPTNEEFISPFRYMQSSVNPLLIREYHKALRGVQ
ncbi:unnamed protein product [Rotaria magnacalcarata]|uniref:PID domain-containing protein n=1 Tax=Rotaria magnacalcarata TaxID=392030 RepID=A0A816RNV9_9BILA|nr:unnamed protein product [Rotaria magnacalcarata]CAF3874868.1 unnamed protein product [Rotaria magnacalcarata]